MALRTIMIFPQFDNMEIIDSIRKRYDPLAELVRPHITLVFPFESGMSNAELQKILNVRLGDIPSFEIKMQGFACHSVPSSNDHFLFLKLILGADLIKKIHDILYENEFRPYCKDFEYDPHMTVGKLSSEDEIEEAYEQVRDIDDVFVTKVDKISVEMIGENEESIIIIEKDLPDIRQ